jgi:hypothetical protein
MIPADDPRAQLEPDEAAFVAQLRASYAPEPLSPARCAAFDGALRERLDGRAHRPGALPTLGALLAAGLAVMFLLSPGEPPPAETEAPSRAALASDTWAQELLVEDAVGYGERLRGEGDEPLPPQYAAIAGMFLR